MPVPYMYTYTGGRSAGSEVGIDKSRWEREIGQRLFGSGSGSGTSSGTVAGIAFVTPTALATLLGDIPIANDGDVIEPDYHNSLREALLALAAFLGQGALTQAQVLTYGPALIPTPIKGQQASTWQLHPEYAAAKGAALGWLPVDLPDGVQLQSLSVTATREEKLRGMDVALGCLTLGRPDDSSITLAELSLASGDGTVHTDSAPISPAGSSDPNLVASLGTVDNSKYRYFISVELDGTQQQNLATIYHFQISYTLP